MIAINRDYGTGTEISNPELEMPSAFLRTDRKNILIYIDEGKLGEDSKDSTAYVYNTLKQLPEKYNVMISHEKDASLAKGADIIFSRFDPSTDIDEVKKQKEFLEQLVQYENGRLFYNRPSVQLAYRDKGYLERLAGTGLIPESLFTSSPHEVFNFMSELGEDVVIKPIFGFGGNGIKGFRREDYNGAIDYLDDLLLDGQERVIVQRFLPEIYTEGDKRVILVDGEVIGARLRRPADGSILSNLHAGGSAEDTVVTPKDLRVVEGAKEWLSQICEGWWGLDIIGNYLGEANGSSPGLAYAIDRANQNTKFTDAIKRGIERSKQVEVVA